MSQSITSAVAVPPMLWIPHQLVGAPLGYSVTLECYTEAHPTSLNYWAREDGLMIHESSKYKAMSSPDRPSYKTHMTLTIYDIQVSGCFSRFTHGELYSIWFSKLILWRMSKRFLDLCSCIGYYSRKKSPFFPSRNKKVINGTAMITVFALSKIIREKLNDANLLAYITN